MKTPDGVAGTLLTVRSLDVQCCCWLFAESFAEVFQSGFARQFRIGFLHAVHKVLRPPAIRMGLPLRIIFCPFRLIGE